MTNDLYTRIGGEAAVDAAVNIFYTHVLSDPLLAPFFKSTDIPRQIEKQKAFLTLAFGGPNHYTGRGLRNAHRTAVASGMTDAHFDQVLLHLGNTLQELQVPQHMIAEAAAIAESTRNDVLNR